MNLTDDQKEYIQGNILESLKTGEAWEAWEDHFPSDLIINAVMDIEGMEKDPSDESSKDGFSQDDSEGTWWQDFIYNGREWYLTGCWTAGGHSFNPSQP